MRREESAPRTRLPVSGHLGLIRNIRATRFTLLMIDADQAHEIEERLAALLGIRVADVRDYVNGNIRAGERRRTSYRFVRGTHSGTYVSDPDGNDILPAGQQVPA